MGTCRVPFCRPGPRPSSILLIIRRKLRGGDAVVAEKADVGGDSIEYAAERRCSLPLHFNFIHDLLHVRHLGGQKLGFMLQLRRLYAAG